MCEVVAAAVDECVCGYLVVLQNRRVKERCAWMVRALVLSWVVYWRGVRIFVPIKKRLLFTTRWRTLAPVRERVGQDCNAWAETATNCTAGAVRKVYCLLLMLKRL